MIMILWLVVLGFTCQLPASQHTSAYRVECHKNDTISYCKAWLSTHHYIVATHVLGTNYYVATENKQTRIPGDPQGAPVLVRRLENPHQLFAQLTAHAQSKSL